MRQSITNRPGHLIISHVNVNVNTMELKPSKNMRKNWDGTTINTIPSPTSFSHMHNTGSKRSKYLEALFYTIQFSLLLSMYKTTLFVAYVNVILDAKYRKMRQKSNVGS